MQRALAELNDELERHYGVRLANRTGVNTGEVVSGDSTTAQRLVTGDAVNVAARLEQAAGEQEVLLGDLTYRLVRDYVEVEAVEPLELKGKAEPVPAYRLVSLHESGERPRRLDAPMVGRDRELGVLHEAFAEAAAECRPRLVTVVAEAGVGKSRLVDEFVRSLDDKATVLRGRCLAYGDGITFWPLAEAVRQAAEIVERDTSDAAHAKLSALVDDPDVAARVASAIGLSQEPFPVQELYWGARKLVEELSASQPLVVLFDDIHWAEETFLELIEHVVANADARLLVVCPTRRELIERAPEWSVASPARRFELRPLSDDQTGEVAEYLLGQAGLADEVRARVVEAAEGNPLFVEQLLSMLIDEGLIRFEDGCWRATGAVARVSVPPTIQALLAARLDYLDADERAVIEPAAVIGSVFVKDAVEHLTTESLRPAVGAQLQALTTKQFVREDRSRPEEDAFRFHHILIRDTTYEGILKRGRATLHERFVEWADGVNREGAVEYEEILGYHLEQAHRYLSELGPLGDHGRALGEDAASRLSAAGHRAFARGDAPAAANLLSRAAALLDDDHPVGLMLSAEAGEALLQAGRFSDAESALEHAIDRGRTLGVGPAVAHASLVRLLLRLRTGDPENWRREAAETIAEAMAVFQGAEDHAGLAKAWRLLAWTHGTANNFGNAAEASEHAVEHARIADDRRQQAQAATAYAAAAVFGPTPVPEAIERFQRILLEVSGARHSEGVLLALLGTLKALQGAPDDGRRHAAEGRAMLEELGLTVEVAIASLEVWRIEMLAGAPAAAERELRRAYELLTAVGEKYLLCSVAGLLGQTLYELGRYDEIGPLAEQAKELASPSVDDQALWRCIGGKLLAREGRIAEGEVLVREAIELLAPTDAVLFRFGALLDLAEIKRIAGSDATAELTEARRLAEEKGSPTLAQVAELLRLAAV